MMQNVAHTRSRQAHRGRIISREHLMTKTMLMSMIITKSGFPGPVHALGAFAHNSHVVPLPP